MKFTHLELSLLITGTISVIGGSACLAASLMIPANSESGVVIGPIPQKNNDNIIYSDLTGLATTAELKNAPAFCIQTPNGTDGARPQAGLNQAGVVFEAIAEAGITRFAAIYQNPTSAVIGPIRSLRMYYLQWDTPFNCTIVHAGGADDALAAVKSGGYRDLTENYTYMYRGSVGARRWNNLFTTADYLKQMNNDRGYGGSEIRGFTRMTPEESIINRVNTLSQKTLEITEQSEGNTSELKPVTSSIALKFGGMPNFNVNYEYNAETNSYNRSYESGAKHEVYNCPETNLGEVNPESACELKQLSPSVVVAIKVKEKKAWDNYHEDITTLGSGDAYIFQNGYAIKGTWAKNTVADQIKFYDSKGLEIKLAPGQTFIEAIPNYGSVEY